MKVKVVSRILEANDRIAGENRKRFKEAGVFVANLMGAPGAGKTTLLEETIKGSSRICGSVSLKAILSALTTRSA